MEQEAVVEETVEETVEVVIEAMAEALAEVVVNNLFVAKPYELRLIVVQET